MNLLEVLNLGKPFVKNVLPEPPSCYKVPRTLPFLICAKVKHKKCHDKSNYVSAKKFNDAAKHNKDDVFTRNADWLRDNKGSSVKSVVSVDIYCHNICRQNYMRKWERDIKPEASEKLAITNTKRVLFTRAIQYIGKILMRECCNMTDIVEFAAGRKGSYT